MLYEGWDIGINNLSYCIINYDSGKYEIKDWKIINLSGKTNIMNNYTCCSLIGKSTDICGKIAKYMYLDSNKSLCGMHSKNTHFNKNKLIDIYEYQLSLHFNKL